MNRTPGVLLCQKVLEGCGRDVLLLPKVQKGQNRCSRKREYARNGCAPKRAEGFRHGWDACSMLGMWRRCEKRKKEKKEEDCTVREQAARIKEGDLHGLCAAILKEVHGVLSMLACLQVLARIASAEQAVTDNLTVGRSRGGDHLEGKERKGKGYIAVPA
eukprot:scaffold142896_cov22-Tisochrysis_lutea.AAC.1